MLAKVLICLLFLTGLTAHAEFIMKPYEIDNVMVTFHWFDTEEELQEYYFENFAEDEGETEIDQYLRGFSNQDVDASYVEKNICHLDIYAVRPLEVDDAYTGTIGHEVLHCVYGPGYHVKWKAALIEVTIEVKAP